MYSCKKILFPAAAGVSLLCTLLYCSRFDSTTDLGKDIISRNDTSLVSFDDKFLTFSGDTSLTLSATSIPENAKDTRFGVHESKLSVGTLGDEHASGFVEFKIDSNFVKKFTSKDTLQNIIFRVDADVHDSTESAAINLMFSKTTEASRYTCKTPDLNNDTLAFIKIKDTTRYFDTLSPTLTSTIFEACTSFAACTSKCDEKDTACRNSCNQFLKNPKSFQFSLTTSDSLTRFGYPSLIVTFKRDTSVIQYKLPASYINYVVSEDEDSVSVLSQEPIASFASRRTALFTLDLKPVWDALDNRVNFNRVLSAGLTINCSMNWSEIKDSTIYFNYFFSKNRITNGVTLDSTMNASGRQGSFIFKDSATVLSIENFIQSLVSTKPSYGYLYINLKRPSGTDAWQKSIWKKPNLKLVATASKR